MASFKAVILVVIACAIAAINVRSSPITNEIGDTDFLEPRAKNISNNLVVGNRQYGDKIIFQENITEKFLVSGKKLIVNRTIVAPNNYVITQVRCLDKITDGTGAEPTVIGGGPDQTWVNLRFKSQRWRGIYFTVEVYAKSRY